MVNANPPPGLNPLSVKLLFVAVPLLIVSSIPLYRRVVLGQERRKQLGEFTPDGGLRIFDEAETAKREQQTIASKIFGSETRSDVGLFSGKKN